MPDETPVLTSEAARAEIERTRARMSETIDEIEETLIRKRDDLRKRFDLVARVREKPLQAAGIALGVGLLLGLLTSGRKAGRSVVVASESVDRWEGRARRLLEIARQQEAEIDDLELLIEDAIDQDEIVDSWDDDDLEDEFGGDELDEGEDEKPSKMTGLKEVIAERVEEFAANTVATLLDAIRRRR